MSKETAAASLVASQLTFFLSFFLRNSSTYIKREEMDTNIEIQQLRLKTNPKSPHLYNRCSLCSAYRCLTANWLCSALPKSRSLRQSHSLLGDGDQWTLGNLLREERGAAHGVVYMGNRSIASFDSATWMGRCPSSRWTGGSGLLVHCFTFTHVFGAWYDSSVNSQLLHLIKAYFFSVLVICLPGAGFQFSHAKIIQIRWCLAVLTKYQVTVLSRCSK